MTQGPKQPIINVKDDDGELRSMLDDLRALERPVMTRSDLIRKLVRDAWEKSRKSRK